MSDHDPDAHSDLRERIRAAQEAYAEKWRQCLRELDETETAWYALKTFWLPFLGIVAFCLAAGVVLYLAR